MNEFIIKLRKLFKLSDKARTTMVRLCLLAHAHAWSEVQLLEQTAQTLASICSRSNDTNKWWR